MTRVFDRAVCRVLDHVWVYKVLGLQRGCERCGRWEWKDLLRGGWVKMPVRLPKPKRGKV